jgi:hypothetical protein
MNIKTGIAAIWLLLFHITLHAQTTTGALLESPNSVAELIKGKSVQVGPLKDGRTLVKSLDDVFGVVTIEGATYYFNKNERYEGGNALSEIRVLFKNALESTGLFSKVATQDNATKVDYVLTATVLVYDSFSESTENQGSLITPSSMFGLLGAVLAGDPGYVAKHSSEILIKDITLVDNNTKSVIWSSDIAKKTEFQRNGPHTTVSTPFKNIEEAMKGELKSLVSSLASARIKEAEIKK